MMGWTLSCNGLDFLFKTISSWVGHCVVMAGTLSCLVWGTVLVMGVNSLPMGGTLCCNGWDIVLLCVCVGHCACDGWDMVL